MPSRFHDEVARRGRRSETEGQSERKKEREREGRGGREKEGETKERPKEQVRETRVDSKWRRGESRVNCGAENATKVRAAKGLGENGRTGAKEDDLWLCVAR